MLNVRRLPSFTPAVMMSLPRPSRFLMRPQLLTRV
jgi:hypothetical protein